MAQDHDVGLLYFCTIKHLGTEHGTSEMLRRATESGFSGDATTARAAIELLPPHQHHRIMSCYTVLADTAETKGRTRAA